MTKWDSILIVWIIEYCGYKAAWSFNFIKSSPKGRDRNQAEDAEAEGIQTLVGRRSVK